AEHVPAVQIQAAATGQQVGAVDVRPARLRQVGEYRGFHALVVLAGDEVDDTADGVGAVHGRGAVAQHLDPVDRGERGRAEVHRAALEAVGGDAAAVEQHQGRVGALPAQVGAGDAVVAALLLVDDAGVAGQVVRRVAGDVHVHQQLFGRGNALGLDLGALEHRDRELRLGVGP